jgi:MFS family permease
MAADPQLWLLGLVQMASFGLVVVTGTWITLLLREALRLAAREAGLLGSMVLMLGIVARPSGGAMVARFGVRPVLICGLLMAAGGCFLLGAATSIALVIPAILLVGIGGGLPFAALFNRAAAICPGRAGAAMGLVNMLGIVMVLAGAPMVGYVADRSGSFRSSFVALGIFALLAFAASFGIRKK